MDLPNSQLGHFTFTSLQLSHIKRYMKNNPPANVQSYTLELADDFERVYGGEWSPDLFTVIVTNRMNSNTIQQGHSTLPSQTPQAYQQAAGIYSNNFDSTAVYGSHHTSAIPQISSEYSTGFTSAFPIPQQHGGIQTGYSHEQQSQVVHPLHFQPSESGLGQSMPYGPLSTVIHDTTPTTASTLSTDSQSASAMSSGKIIHPSLSNRPLPKAIPNTNPTAASSSSTLSQSTPAVSSEEISHPIPINWPPDDVEQPSLEAESSTALSALVKQRKRRQVGDLGVFQPRQVQAWTLWGQDRTDVTQEVERLKALPGNTKLDAGLYTAVRRSMFMNLPLKERDTWEKKAENINNERALMLSTQSLEDRIDQLHRELEKFRDHARNALNLHLISIIGVPQEGASRGDLHIVNLPDKKGIEVYVDEKYGKYFASKWLGAWQDYWEDVTTESSDESRGNGDNDGGAQGGEEEEQPGMDPKWLLGDEWMEGFGSIPLLDGHGVVELRGMLRQRLGQHWFNRGYKGWKGRHIPWLAILKTPHVFVKDDPFGPGTRFFHPDATREPLETALGFLIAHQEGKVSFLDGIVFKDAGSPGTENWAVLNPDGTIKGPSPLPLGQSGENVGINDSGASNQDDMGEDANPEQNDSEHGGEGDSEHDGEGDSEHGRKESSEHGGKGDSEHGGEGDSTPRPISSPLKEPAVSEEHSAPLPIKDQGKPMPAKNKKMAAPDSNLKLRGQKRKRAQHDGDNDAEDPQANKMSAHVRRSGRLAGVGSK